MRKSIFYLIILSLLGFASCKTSKTARNTSAYKKTENLTTEVAKASSENESEAATELPITMKTESFDIAQGEDQSKGDYAFYVIIGSFANLANAEIFKSQLLEKGMIPVILISETSMFRISVNQTNL
jgi:hypothetical protein